MGVGGVPFCDITKGPFYRPLGLFACLKGGFKTRLFQEAEPHLAVSIVTDLEGGIMVNYDITKGWFQEEGVDDVDGKIALLLQFFPSGL